MDQREFLRRIKAKIERLTGTDIQLRLDITDKNQIKVELKQTIPEVVLGSNVLEYSGFARMAIEYVVDSIRKGKEPGALEFHILLARN